MKLIDTHCHLDFPEFDADREQVISLAKEQGIATMVNIGSSLQGSRASVALAQSFDCIYAAVGVHPHDADSVDAQVLSELKALAGQKKVVAIGETGLDYFRNLSKKENQVSVFRASIALAEELHLPLVIHCREAQDDLLRILKERTAVTGVVHCFSGDERFMKACLDLGLYLSFTCNITYKKADVLRSVMQEAPLGRIMLETDAPYLSPEGFRGRRNDPSQVRLLAQECAKIKGISVEEVARQTTDNAIQLFKL